MKNTILGLLVASFLIAAPLAASAQSTDVQSQINALLQQIKVLQQKIADLVSSQTGTSGIGSSVSSGVSTVSSSIITGGWCNISRTLTVGSSGQDVTDLQTFLQNEGAFNTQPTGFFGSITAGAVAKWQASQGLSSVGVVGPLTRSRILIRCGGTPVTSSALQAKPSAGPAPLNVSFTTSASIADAAPSIDFGDGQQAQMDKGSCVGITAIVGAQGGIRCSYTSTHVYTSNGTYTATASISPCGGNPQCMAPTKLVGSSQITVGATIVCKPINFMPIACADGSAAKPVQDENGCTIRFECPVIGFTPPANCKAWNDGCNICSRETPTSPAMCTLRACMMTTGDASATANANTVTANIWAGKGYCTAYFDTTTGNKPPVISSFSGPTTLSVGQTGTWNISASDPENGTLSYHVIWGDETYATSPNAYGATALTDAFVQSTTFTHSYASAGIYTVKITVRDSAGMSADTSTTVQVGSGVACTTEYAPVCGQPPEPACRHSMPACMIATPGPATYSNRCVMNAAGATFISEGACSTTF